MSQPKTKKFPFDKFAGQFFCFKVLSLKSSMYCTLCEISVLFLLIFNCWNKFILILISCLILSIFMRLLEQYHFKNSKLTKLTYNGFYFRQFPSIIDMFPLFIILLSSLRIHARCPQLHKKACLSSPVNFYCKSWN